MSDTGDLILFQTEDGQARMEVRLAGESVWLSAGQMVELFQRDKSVISRHIQNVFEEGELERAATVAKFAIVQREGDREVSREVEFYNLDVIISVGYRVKSHRGTQFRIWATRQLREYLVKGFLLNDEKFKQGKGSAYFDELLARIRDIRSSEKEFWRKVLEIYATSVDYNPTLEASQQFFAIVQNKMHWAAHGHTAAELIHQRADAAKPHMGLTSWTAGRVEPRRADVTVAKNYLTAAELDALNRIVSMYLDFAELQALNRRPMTMAAWIEKLDQFLQISEREILTHAGRISAEVARLKAEGEYDTFRKAADALPGPGEKDFQKALGKARQIEKSTGQPGAGS